MGIETAILAVGAAAALGGTATSFIAGRRSAKAQKKRSRNQERAQALEEDRRRRQQIRERRVRTAQIQNAGGNSGVIDSSGVSGGVSSVGSQFAYNSGILSQQRGINNAINSANQDIASAQELGQIGSGISAVGGTLFSQADTISRSFGSVFNTSAKQTQHLVPRG